MVVPLLAVALLLTTVLSITTGSYMEKVNDRLDAVEKAIAPIPDIKEHVNAVLRMEATNSQPYTWQQLKEDFGIELVCANWKELPRESLYNKNGIQPCTNIVGIKLHNGSIKWIEFNGKKTVLERK